ncbi:MAG: transketolase [Planctomycetota bacterium]
MALFANESGTIPAGFGRYKTVMREVLCNTLLKYSKDKNFVFLTGDLGFRVLEPLKQRLGERFINAGVAEQNMVSVAAGLARAGLRPWLYSIAPFIYARPFEQIRNDVCMHDLPVKLIGNGGGYAYGVMGPTHHALEDYGLMLSLKNMYVFVPAFAFDIHTIVEKLYNFEHPAYIRLGRDEKPEDFEPLSYAPWRRVICGCGPTMLVVGPLVGKMIKDLGTLDEKIRPDIWCLTELPISASTIPQDFIDDLKDSGHLFVVEEHIAHGGAGQMLVHLLSLEGIMPKRLTHRCALGYVSGLYGSQEFHRRECGLDTAGIIAELKG